MGEPARRTYRIGGLSIEERPLGHGDPGLMPGSVAEEIERRFPGEPGFDGRCQRIAIRDGFDLTLYDLKVERSFTGGGASPPGLLVAILLDGDGEGFLASGADGAEPTPVPYRGGTSYFFFARAPIAGHYRVPPGTRFRLLEIRCTESFLARVAPRLLASPVTSGHSLHLASGDAVWIGLAKTAPAVAAAARAVLDGHLGDDPHVSDLTIEASTLAILETSLSTLRAPSAPAGGRSEARRVAEARALMLADPARAWTIRELGRRVGLNDKKLKSGFRACYGVPVHQFLLRARLDVARAMLAGGATNVTEASLAVGYANPSHLARLFRREFGLSPSQFVASGRAVGA